jgi:hypothetical protein
MRKKLTKKLHNKLRNKKTLINKKKNKYKHSKNKHKYSKNKHSKNKHSKNKHSKNKHKYSKNKHKHSKHKHSKNKYINKRVRKKSLKGGRWWPFYKNTKVDTGPLLFKHRRQRVQQKETVTPRVKGGTYVSLNPKSVKAAGSLGPPSNAEKIKGFGNDEDGDGYLIPEGYANANRLAKATLFEEITDILNKINQIDNTEDAIATVLTANLAAKKAKKAKDAAQNVINEIRTVEEAETKLNTAFEEIKIAQTAVATVLKTNAEKILEIINANVRENNESAISSAKTAIIAANYAIDILKTTDITKVESITLAKKKINAAFAAFKTLKEETKFEDPPQYVIPRGGKGEAALYANPFENESVRGDGSESGDESESGDGDGSENGSESDFHGIVARELVKKELVTGFEENDEGLYAGGTTSKSKAEETFVGFDEEAGSEAEAGSEEE